MPSARSGRRTPRRLRDRPEPAARQPPRRPDQAAGRAPAAVTEHVAGGVQRHRQRVPRGGQVEVPRRADAHPQPPPGEPQVAARGERVLEEHLAGGRPGPHREPRAAPSSPPARARPAHAAPSRACVVPVAAVVGRLRRARPRAGSRATRLRAAGRPAARRGAGAHPSTTIPIATIAAMSTTASAHDGDAGAGIEQGHGRDLPRRHHHDVRDQVGPGVQLGHELLRVEAELLGVVADEGAHVCRAGQRVEALLLDARAGTSRGCASRPRSRRSRCRVARARRAAWRRLHPFRPGFCLRWGAASTAPAVRRRRTAQPFRSVEVSTTSRSWPLIWFSVCRASSLKSGLEKPEM